MRHIKKSNILLVPFIVLTLSITVLCVLVQLLLQNSLDDMKSDTAITAAATHQRVLANQVVNNVAADNLGGILTQPSLDTLLRDFYTTHKLLLALDKKRVQEDADYIKMFNDMDITYGEFSKAVMVNASSDSDNYNKFVLLLKKQADYVKQLDLFIAAVNGNSDAKVERFKIEELFLTAFSLAIVIIEVIFIFLPAIQKIKKQSRQFRAIAFNNSHIIRQPLANIKGLLDIIDASKLDNETNEIFGMLKQEADKLDDVIKNNILHTIDE